MVRNLESTHCFLHSIAQPTRFLHIPQSASPIQPPKTQAWFHWLPTFGESSFSVSVTWSGRAGVVVAPMFEAKRAESPNREEMDSLRYWSLKNLILYMAQEHHFDT